MAETEKVPPFWQGEQYKVPVPYFTNLFSLYTLFSCIREIVQYCGYAGLIALPSVEKIAASSILIYITSF